MRECIFERAAREICEGELAMGLAHIRRKLDRHFEMLARFVIVGSAERGSAEIEMGFR